MKLKSLVLSFFILFILLVAGASQAATVQTLDGAIIYYETKGAGNPILFVHGWTMSGKVWDKQMDMLSQNYQVIRMDLRAHGNSSKALHGHTIPQYARDVQAVINDLKLKRITLIGWSLGGPVVLEYCKQFGTGRLAALGLVDMTPFPFSPAEWNAHGLKNYNYNAMNNGLVSLQDNRKAFAEKFINNMFKSATAPPEDMEWIMKENLKTPTPVAVAIYSDYLMRDYTGVLNKITMPTIIFSGDSNIFKKGIEMGKYIQTQIPGSTFVSFEKSGHMPFYEEPEKFNNALFDFLKITQTR
jgi:pimeloyl-ACP methyl ester carboxylesterase